MNTLVKLQFKDFKKSLKTLHVVLSLIILYYRYAIESHTILRRWRYIGESLPDHYLGSIRQRSQIYVLIFYFNERHWYDKL